MGNFVDIWVWLTTAAITLVGAMLTFRYKYIQTTFIFLTIFFAGALLVLHQQKNDDIKLSALPKIPQNLNNHKHQENSGKYIYKAVVMSEPVVRGKTVSCDLFITTGGMTGQKVKGHILRDTVNHNYKRLHVGDGILAVSVMRSPRNYYQSNFEYETYLKIHGFTATTFIYWNNWKKVEVSLSHLPVFVRFQIASLKFRQQLINKYRKEGIGENELAVLAALTLGDKSLLTKELRNDYSVSGSAHVLAMSGLHLSIIYFLLTFLFWGNRRRLLTQALAVITIWGFVLLAGMSASLMRSGLMLTIYALVTILNRNRASLNALSLAAIVLIIQNPRCIHDVGFQLSFMAVFFILMMLPSVEKWVSNEFLLRHRVIKAIWGMVTVTLVAQLGVLPLVIYYFGRIPCYFLLSSFIVIPCVTVILYGAVAFFVLPPLQSAIAAGLNILIGWLNSALQWIASLPGASIEGIEMNWAQVILMYLLIGVVSALIKKVALMK